MGLVRTAGKCRGVTIREGSSHIPMHPRLSPDDEKALGCGLLAQPLVAGAIGFALSSWSVQMGVLMGVLFAITAAVITVCLAYPLLWW